MYKVYDSRTLKFRTFETLAQLRTIGMRDEDIRRVARAKVVVVGRLVIQNWNIQ